MGLNNTVPNWHRGTGASADNWPFKQVRRTSVKTPRQNLAVELGAAKLFLRVDNSDEDSLIESLIEASTNLVEGYLDRTLITTQYTLSLDYSPYVEDTIYLPAEPLQSVDEFRYYEDDGTEHTWSDTNYHVFEDSSRLVVKEGTEFPTGTRRGVRVQIDYTSGYGDNPSDIPNAIQQGTLHLVASLYENREGTTAIPPAAKALLQPYKRIHIF